MSGLRGLGQHLFRARAVLVFVLAFVALAAIAGKKGGGKRQETPLTFLVLAPLVVFDGNCNRIGMGGGFYDRSFAFRKNPAITRPRLIGVAHETQKVEHIVPEQWDVQLDMIVTEQMLYQ